MSVKKCFLAVFLSLSSLFSFAFNNDSLIHLDYHWLCHDVPRSCSLTVDGQLLDYYRNHRGHTVYQYDDTPFNSPSNYSSFMFSEHDREVVRLLVAQCCAADSTELGCIESALSFVQSLPYVTDMKSKRVDEYVRYPVETLADGVGDCEDKVVLLSAMLHELGVDYVLLVMPDHLALGVHCDSVKANHYLNVDGKRYHYMETTTKNWEIGQIPKEFSTASFEVAYCTPAPILVSRKMSFRSDPTLMYDKASCHITLRLFNMGPGKVTGVKIYVELVESGRRKNEVLFMDTFLIADLEEGEEREERIEFKSLMHGANRLRMSLFADGVPQQDFDLTLQ